MVIRFMRLDQSGEDAVDLVLCTRCNIPYRRPSKFQEFDDRKVSVFYRTPADRWIQALEGLRQPEGTGFYLEVRREDVLERWCACGLWPIPAELSPDAPQASVSDPGEGTSNPSSPSRENPAATRENAEKLRSAMCKLGAKSEERSVKKGCLRRETGLSEREYREAIELLKAEQVVRTKRGVGTWLAT